MKPADFTTYSDDQWLKIKRHLARFDVDANTVLMGKPQRSLRDKLQRLAARYVERSQLKSATPKQIERMMDETRAKVSAARCLFEPGQPVQFFLRHEKLADEAHRVLGAIESELQGRHGRWYCEHDTYEASNAEKEARNDYILKLLQVWRQLVGAEHDRARAGFLLACTTPFKFNDKFKFNAKQIDYLLHHGLPNFLKRKSKAHSF